MMRVLLEILGLQDANSKWYLWWSGFGGNAFLVVAALVYRRLTCDVPGCYGVGWRRQELTGKSFCTKHHRLGELEAAESRRRAAQEGELPSE